MDGRRNCPNCGSSQTIIIYKIENIPTNSVLIIKEKKQAVNFPTGNIVLKYCNNCTFIFNSVFNSKISNYSQDYEGTQAFSSTFNTFMYNLADKLIKDLSIKNKKILEIGCGQGEFLEILCEKGNNKGLGYDPTYRQRLKYKNIIFFREFFNENSKFDSDISFIICKMTLEHIQDTKKFVSMIRGNIGDNETKIFFQVPNTEKILRNGAFWDIYYEHCSYFCKQSLSYLFKSCGFNIINLWKDYDDQYLFLVAEPSHNESNFQQNYSDFKDSLKTFNTKIKTKISLWKKFISTHKDEKIILWGGGSKAVSFLTTLKLGDEISYVIDINPNKENTYLPVTGHQVQHPDYLRNNPIDIIIVMNQIYKNEISNYVHQLSLYPEIVTVEGF